MKIKTDINSNSNNINHISNKTEEKINTWNRKSAIKPKKQFNNFTTISAEYYADALKQKRPLSDMVGEKYKNILDYGNKIVKKQEAKSLKYASNKPKYENEIQNLYDDNKKRFIPPVMSSPNDDIKLVKGEDTGYLTPLSIIDPKKRPNLKKNDIKKNKDIINKKEIKIIEQKDNEKLTKGEFLKNIRAKQNISVSNTKNDEKYINQLSKQKKNGGKITSPSMSSHDKLMVNLKTNKLVNYNKKWNS